MPDTLKHCPICTQDLPVEKFGVCRARKDGRNLYCMRCIREKVKESRRVLKEYKTLRKNRQSARYRGEVEEPIISISKPDKQSPVERVREAIQNGARTQREIIIETKLGKNEIGDALTVLLLWNREIKSELRGDTRIYFFVEEKKIELPDRKPVVLSPFSEIRNFMPGRKRAVR